MNEATHNQSKFWLDITAAEIEKRYPKGKIVVSSGISPSAHYHIGHFREILTAEAISWRLRQAGREVDHIHIVDDFDPLRRRYDFLPVEYEKYVGCPLYRVPDPQGDCHPSYSEHFFANFEKYALDMGIKPTKTIRNSELYLSGQMTSAIEEALQNIAKIKAVFARLTNRQLDEDWTPIQVMANDEQFEQGKLSSWDQSKQTINGVDYTKGNAKMNWRLEWPARWRILNVMVEPFSHQEHGAAGGSYDTGVEFAREVFKFTPPIAGAQYGNIHLKGDTKKMSSSKGNLYTPDQVLEVMPPEVLRYFVIKSRPEKQLDFDLYEGLYNLLEEYSKVEEAVEQAQTTEFVEALRFAKSLEGAQAKRTVSGVGFNHLVFAYQTARGDRKQIFEILSRTGFGDLVKKEPTIIEAELEYIGRWLSKYAPEQVKFALQASCPAVELTSGEKKFLDDLATALEKSDFLAQTIHDTIYSSAVKFDVKPATAFKILYQLFFNQAHGPKLGFFLSTLEKDLLLGRIRRQT